MSEDWKKDRAEAAMIVGTEAIRKAAESRSKEEEDKKWEDVAASLYVGERNMDDSIDSVLSKLREKYHLPVKK